MQALSALSADVLSDFCREEEAVGALESFAVHFPVRASQIRIVQSREAVASCSGFVGFQQTAVSACV